MVYFLTGREGGRSGKVRGSRKIWRIFRKREEEWSEGQHCSREEEENLASCLVSHGMRPSMNLRTYDSDL